MNINLSSIPSVVIPTSTEIFQNKWRSVILNTKRMKKHLHDLIVFNYTVYTVSFGTETVYKN